MRLKDPFSLKSADMTKRTSKPKKPRDEESSDEVGGKWNTTPYCMENDWRFWPCRDIIMKQCQGSRPEVSFADVYTSA